ncbi:MAG: NAD(P)-dependent oxidoreductase [Thermomicrobiales bacterium]
MDRSSTTDALILALEQRHIAGAGLDVTTPEPLPADSPSGARRTSSSPRPGLVTAQHGARSADLDREHPHFRAGEPLINEVDLDAGY